MGVLYFEDSLGDLLTKLNSKRLIRGYFFKVNRIVERLRYGNSGEARKDEDRREVRLAKKEAIETIPVPIFTIITNFALLNFA